MFKPSRIISLFFSMITLYGCGSPPRAVNAEIPLVEANDYTFEESVPSHIWPILNSTSKNTFSYQDYVISMSPIYKSALEIDCRLLTFTLDDKETGSRVACRDKKQGYNEWFLTKDISTQKAIMSFQ